MKSSRIYFSLSLIKASIFILLWNLAMAYQMTKYQFAELDSGLLSDCTIRGTAIDDDGYSYAVSRCPASNPKGWRINKFKDSKLVWHRQVAFDYGDSFFELNINGDDVCVVGDNYFSHVLVHMFDSNGNIKWTLNNDLWQDYEYSYRVKALSNENYAIVGTVDYQFPLITKISNSPSFIWRSEFFDGLGGFSGVEERSDGSLIALIGHPYWYNSLNYDSCQYARFSSDGDLLYIRDIKADARCEKIKKLLYGDFLLLGLIYDSGTLNSWIYKVSANEDYLWEMTFLIAEDNYVLAANQMTNDDIVLAVYSSLNKFWTIILDSRGNLISQISSSTDSYHLYSGDVSPKGSMVGANYPEDPVAFMKTLCSAGTYSSPNGNGNCLLCGINTYQPSVREVCLPCPEGMYQDGIGKSSCKSCILNCKSCTTDKNCLACYSPYLVHTSNPATVVCVDSCPQGYFVDGLICSKCFYPCKTCSISATSCDKCLGNLVLDEVTGECNSCHPLCDDCYGPLSTQCDSCKPSTDIVFVNPGTCICRNGLYYDEAEGTCKACHSLCSSCFGSSYNQCYGCSTLSYSVEGTQGLCVLDCNSLLGYYREGSECKICHPSCESCFGPSLNNCLNCRNPNKVLYGYKCQDKCPDDSIAVSGMCYACHKSCKSCVSVAKTGCKDCKPNFFLWNGECLLSCPSGTYPLNGVCLQCPLDCKTCLSYDICTECQPEFYMLRNICIERSECPKGTYSDDTTQSCMNCSHECSMCYGPTNKDCKECNLVKGYMREILNYGDCHLLICQDGTYLNISESKVECLPCYKSCSTCTGPELVDCLDCSKGYSKFSKDGLCKTCEKQLIGYFTAPDGSCQEICGDGLNMGSYECDDGNRFDGDGCSSNCKVEFGFGCKTQPDGLNICRDIISPTASLSLLRNDLLLITFSEIVSIKVSSSNLESIMNVTLGKTSCKVNWKANHDFDEDSETMQLEIIVEPECSLKGNIELFVVNFNNKLLIVDINDNELSTRSLSVKTKRHIYVSDTEKAALTAIGSAFDKATIISFIAMFTISMLQSVSLGIVWNFVNTLQILSYLPIINCNFPQNLLIFLRDYLTIKKIAIPISIPTFDLLSYLEFFTTAALNEKFLDMGYESISFIINFSEEITTWILLFIFYLVLSFLQEKCPRSINSYIRGWRRGYKYNGIITILLESYLSMNFCGILNIYNSDLSNLSGIISFTLASIAMFLSLGFLLKSFYLTENIDNELKSSSFNKKYGNIIENIRIENDSIHFHPLYLYRRLIYSILLIVLYDYPLIQLIGIATFIALPKLLYSITVKPFMKKADNVINIYNEIIILFISLCVLMLNLFDFTDRVANNLGWIAIILIMISFLISFTVAIFGAIEDICKKDQVKQKVKLEEEEEHKKKGKSEEKEESKQEVKGDVLNDPELKKIDNKDNEKIEESKNKKCNDKDNKKTDTKGFIGKKRRHITK